jgi:hypothetical protein
VAFASERQARARNKSRFLSYRFSFPVLAISADASEFSCRVFFGHRVVCYEEENAVVVSMAHEVKVDAVCWFID